MADTFKRVTIALGTYKLTGEERYLDDAENLLATLAKAHGITPGQAAARYESFIDTMKV